MYDMFKLMNQFITDYSLLKLSQFEINSIGNSVIYFFRKRSYYIKFTRLYGCALLTFRRHILRISILESHTYY